MTECDPFGDVMNGKKKYVVSATLQNSPWRNTTVIRENVIESVRALREEPGQNLLTDGSSQLVGALLEHGPVDELHLLVYPITLGERQARAAERRARDVRAGVRDPVPHRRGRLALHAEAIARRHPAEDAEETRGRRDRDEVLCGLRSLRVLCVIVSVAVSGPHPVLRRPAEMPLMVAASA